MKFYKIILSVAAFVLVGYIGIQDDYLSLLPDINELFILVSKTIAWIIWAFASFIILSIMVTRKYKPLKSNKRTNVHFYIPTIARKEMKNVLASAIKSIKSFDFDVSVIIDEGADLKDWLEKRRDVGVIVVPKNYRPDLYGKGRAINYVVENFVKENEWYAFMDDDNILLDDEFSYEIEPNEKEGNLVSNPILVPREGKSRISFIMDWIRYLEDLTIFKLFTGVLKKPCMGLHGEMLLARGDVLKKAGFNKKSIAEDFSFTTRVVKLGYKSWQSTTKVSILSPNSVRDFMRQRSRWYWGILEEITHDDATWCMKSLVGFVILTWTLGIFASWLLFPLWLYWEAFFFAIPGAVGYTTIYVYAISKTSDWKYVLLIPLFSIIEALSWLYRPSNGKFVVIDKGE